MIRMEDDPATEEVSRGAVREAVPLGGGEPCGGPDGAERSFKRGRF
jgi:hypothetical protein